MEFIEYLKHAMHHTKEAWDKKQKTDHKCERNNEIIEHIRQVWIALNEIGRLHDKDAQQNICNHASDICRHVSRSFNRAFNLLEMLDNKVIRIEEKVDEISEQLDDL